MKVKRIVLCSIVIWPSFSLGQNYALGIRSQAMGGSGIAYARDPESQLSNIFNMLFLYNKLLPKMVANIPIVDIIIIILPPNSMVFSAYEG